MNSGYIEGKEYDYFFKLILFGNSGVGKGCLFLHFTENTYNDCLPFLGIDYVRNIFLLIYIQLF